MLIGMTLLLVLTYIIAVGGVTAGHAALNAMSDLVPEALAGRGMTG